MTIYYNLTLCIFSLSNKKRTKRLPTSLFVATKKKQINLTSFFYRQKCCDSLILQNISMKMHSKMNIRRRKIISNSGLIFNAILHDDKCWAYFLGNNNSSIMMIILLESNKNQIKSCPAIFSPLFLVFFFFLCCIFTNKFYKMFSEANFKCTLCSQLIQRIK